MVQTWILHCEDGLYQEVNSDATTGTPSSSSSTKAFTGNTQPQQLPGNMGCIGKGGGGVVPDETSAVNGPASKA